MTIEEAIQRLVLAREQYGKAAQLMVQDDFGRPRSVSIIEARSPIGEMAPNKILVLMDDYNGS